jgi:hypothetical protein
MRSDTGVYLAPRYKKVKAGERSEHLMKEMLLFMAILLYVFRYCEQHALSEAKTARKLYKSKNRWLEEMRNVYLKKR